MVFKKPAPQGSKMTRVPQTGGYLGWIVFTYENHQPVCLWMTNDKTEKIPCSFDERLAGDTIMRAEKVGSLTYVVGDVWLYNSNCIFMCSTFSQRYNWLKTFLPNFIGYVEGVTAKFIHKSDASNYKVRGYEDHPNEIGKTGFYVEKEDESQMLQITRMSMPDCYEVGNTGGYLKVPDIKTSRYLRSKGQSFMCKCVKGDEDSWIVTENIPVIE